MASTSAEHRPHTPGMLPRLGTPVFLRNIRHTEHYCQVIEQLSDAVIVTPPATLSDIPDEDETFEMLWVAGGTTRVLPVRLTFVNAAAWRATPTGLGSREQRRKSIRISVAGPVVITVADEPAVITGQLVDITNGSLQCQLPPEVTVPLGTTVRCDFVLGGYSIQLTGVVALGYPTAATSGERIVISWSALEPSAQAVQYFVARESVKRLD